MIGISKVNLTLVRTAGVHGGLAVLFGYELVVLAHVWSPESAENVMHNHVCFRGAGLRHFCWIPESVASVSSFNFN